MPLGKIQEYIWYHWTFNYVIDILK
jgi:hypothetical protein